MPELREQLISIHCHWHLSPGFITWVHDMFMCSLEELLQTNDAFYYGEVFGLSEQVLERREEL